eukprot:scaffold9191_cov114-Isochrysis_galbana.AAC.9
MGMVVGKFCERFARLRADRSCREAKARRGGCSLAVTPTGPPRQESASFSHQFTRVLLLCVGSPES